MRIAFVAVGLAVALAAEAGLSAQTGVPDPRVPQLTAPGKVPHGIQLLPGYAHTSFARGDTLVGRIARAGGIEIRYDIGESAGDHARAYAEGHPRAWTITQSAAGGRAVITMDEPGDLLIVTIRGGANFFGHGVRTRRDVAEMLTMVLGYDGVD